METPEELEHHMLRCKANLEEVFSGFVAVGFPLDGGAMGTPACVLAGDMGVAQMQRMVTVMRQQVRSMEDKLDIIDRMAQEGL